MKISEIIDSFEKIAPSVLQESYDNSGLIIGNHNNEISGVLLSLDVNENVIEEAINNHCNLIVCHHPIIFKGVKRLNGNNNTERCIIKAIENKINIYACHTNLDNVLLGGVNEKISQKIGLTNLKPLTYKEGLINKMAVFVPENDLEKVKKAVFEAGAGHIGFYSECNFTSQGIGEFKANIGANPTLGKINQIEKMKEVKLEFIVPQYSVSQVIKAIYQSHPYEEPAFDVFKIENKHFNIGSGAIGNLNQKMSKNDFLNHLKSQFNLEVIKYTGNKEYVETVAICGGSGSFLISNASKYKVDAFVTADVKYHDFFDAPQDLLYCDIGHYESEIFTLEIFYEIIQEKKPNFAVVFCKSNTNPVK